MELIEITPEDSVVPIYREVLTEKEQAERDRAHASAVANSGKTQAELDVEQKALETAAAKLRKLGLTDAEIAALGA